MKRAGKPPLPLGRETARALWLKAQGLDRAEPFGNEAGATPRAVAHLGYVQIDTINVIERCHHHILFSRIPGYRREHLEAAQSRDKTVFEYWTHALAYLPTQDFRFLLPAMLRHRQAPDRWFGPVSDAEVRRVIGIIRAEGPITIRDIEDDVLIEKDHPWASRKPSKRALQRAFYDGLLTVSARRGMLKTYDLTARHFGWSDRPRPATPAQVTAYMLDRALRSQGVVSVDSAAYGHRGCKPGIAALIERRVKSGRLVPVAIAGVEVPHWGEPEFLAGEIAPSEQVNILSPFDPLIIQRRRLELLFGYLHRFEAYLPREKRVFGYFALPVLSGDRVVAVADLKADRQGGRLLIQQWTWLVEADAALKGRIDAALGHFERFQLDRANENGAP